MLFMRDGHTGFDADLEALWLRVDRLLRALDMPAVAVTGLGRATGVTTLVLGLAQACARTGAAVILVDGHWQHPRLHKAFGMDAGPGVAELFANTVTVEGALRATSIENLRLLSVGQAQNGAMPTAPDPWRDLVERLASDGSRVILDAGPINAPTALAAAAAARKVIMSVESGRSPWEAIRSGLDRLTEQGADVLGVVLNKRRFPIPRFIYEGL